MQDRFVHFFEERWVMPFVRYPWPTIATALVLFVVSLIPLVGGKLQFDYNLLNLYPPGLESLQWQQRITHDGGESIWTGVSIVDSLEEARQLAQVFETKPTVARVGGVALLFPENEEEQLTLMREVNAQLGPTIGDVFEEDASDLAAVQQVDLLTQLSGFRFLINTGIASGQIPHSVHAPRAWPQCRRNTHNGGVRLHGRFNRRSTRGR